MTKLAPLLHYHAKTKKISHLAWSSDGERVAISSRADQTLALIQSRSAQEISSASHRMSINTVAWSPDDAFLALGGSEALGAAEPPVLPTRSRGALVVLDVHRQQIIRAFATTEAVNALAWSPDHLWLAIAARDVTVWDVRQQKEISKIGAENGLAASSVGWVQDGRHVLVAWSASGSAIERTLTIHAAATGKQTTSIEVDKGPWEDREPMTLCSLALAPMGTSIAVSGAYAAVKDDPEAPIYGIIHLIDLVTRQERQLAAGMHGRRVWGPFIQSLSWSHDGRLLAASSGLDDTFVMFDVSTRNRIATGTVEKGPLEPAQKQTVHAVQVLAWSPVDDRLAVATSHGCTIYQAQQ